MLLEAHVPIMWVAEARTLAGQTDTYRGITPLREFFSFTWKSGLSRRTGRTEIHYAATKNILDDGVSASDCCICSPINECALSDRDRRRHRHNGGFDQLDLRDRRGRDNTRWNWYCRSNDRLRFGTSLWRFSPRWSHQGSDRPHKLVLEHSIRRHRRSGQSDQRQLHVDSRICVGRRYKHLVARSYQLNHHTRNVDLNRRLRKHAIYVQTYDPFFRGRRRHLQHDQLQCDSELTGKKTRECPRKASGSGGGEEIVPHLVGTNSHVVPKLSHFSPSRCLVHLLGPHGNPAHGQRLVGSGYDLPYRP